MGFEKLINETKKLVKQETAVSAQIIRNLKTLFVNKVHIEERFDSFFTFCVKRLEMTEADAQRKGDAMRLTLIVDDVPDRIVSGELNFSKINVLAKFIREEKKEAGRTFENKEVEKLLEEVQEKETTREAVKHLSTVSLIEDKKPKDLVKFHKGKARLDFEISDECEEFLERYKQIHSHKGKQPMGEILLNLLKEHLQKQDPAQKDVKKAKDVQIQIAAPLLSRESTRHVPVATRRLVMRKYEGRCQSKNPETGRVCGSRFCVQIEHIQPFSLGGTHDPLNLTLLCRAHNLYEAEKMGLLKM